MFDCRHDSTSYVADVEQAVAGQKFLSKLHSFTYLLHGEPANSKELEQYQNERTNSAAERMMVVARPCLVMFLCMSLLHSIAFRDWYYCLLPVLLMVCFEMVHSMKRLQSNCNRLLIGCAAQVICYWLSVLCTICFAWSMPTVLMQHRVFLTSALPVYIAWPILGYVPVPIYMCFVAPAFLCAWICFHSVVGFLNVPCIATACLICSLSTYVFWKADQRSWDHFKMEQALGRERQRLRATQDMLHGMLSSPLDASCICSRRGYFLECTPQLEQLLSNGSCLSGSLLNSFVASQPDEERLEQFLATCADKSICRVTTLQLSLRSCTAGTIRGADTNSKSPDGQKFEVSLYGIAVPDEGFEHGGNPRCDSRIFLALQVAAAPITEFVCDESTELKDFGSDVNELSNLVIATAQNKSMEQNSLWDLDFRRASGIDNPGSVPSEMSFALTSSCQNTMARTREEAVQAEMCEQNEEETRSLLSVSKVKEVTDEEFHELANTLNTQILHSCSSACSKEIQTEPERPSQRPPSLHKVKLGGRLCFMKHFQETPKHTVEQLVLLLILQLNPRGKGCCFMHVGLVSLHRQISGMIRGRCSDMDPNNSWQCSACKVVHDADSDDEDNLFCAVCGGGMQPHCLQTERQTSHTLKEFYGAESQSNSSNVMGSEGPVDEGSDYSLT